MNNDTRRSDRQRWWGIFFVAYVAALALYAITTREAFSSIDLLSSQDWIGPAIFLMFPAAVVAYAINGIWIAIIARKESKPEGRWETAARERNCYCGIWDKDPAMYEGKGYPRGYCGVCDRCGIPGHTRHFPGPVPYTGSWCDRCYRILAWTWPFRSLGGWIYILAVVAIVVAIVRPLLLTILR